MAFTLEFQNGTLVISSENEELPKELERVCHFDSRIDAWRAEPCYYASIFRYFYKNKQVCQDLARAYQVLELESHDGRTPRYYQQEALESWKARHRQGVVVIPTGTGKSFLAQMAILDCRRSTLIVAPTIDLVEQWVAQLKKNLYVPVGMLGGGTHEICDITVSTYDSALLMMEFIGNKFGLLIVDECHHLPGECYQQIARMCLAPYRLGLTATPDRQEESSEDVFASLLGSICYRKEIDELEGEALAPYQVYTVPVELDDDEAQEYERQRNIYLEFIRSNNIYMGAQNGWIAFIRACCRLPGGREAFRAQIAQKSIARSCRDKFRKIWQLLMKHRCDRTIIFTADNLTAYTIGERFLLPVLTHHTKGEERHELLEAFRRGEVPVLVTSKVLNEGVDVPEANVGIVVSGSGSIREHVQRLGRILRQSEGKTAVLYELVSEGTSEQYVSERRRQHRAYERPSEL